MKKILLISALLILIASPVWALSTAIQAVVSAGGVACTTPNNGDEIDEGFLGAGYEVAGWTEVVGAGGTADEDAALPGTPPSGSCAEGLHLISNGAVTYAYWDRGSAIDASEVSYDTILHVYLNDVVLDNFSKEYLYLPSAGTNPASASALWILQLYNNNGTYQIYIEASDFGGGTDSTAVTFAEDTWYTITIHHDAGTPANSYFQVVGGGSTTCDVASECTFTHSDGASDPRYFIIGGSRLTGADETVDVYFGYISINTP